MNIVSITTTKQTGSIQNMQITIDEIKQITMQIF